MAVLGLRRKCMPMYKKESKPYSINLFIPSGNPRSLKIIDKMNWTGKCLVVSREEWDEYKIRHEFNQAGIYR